MRTTDIYFIPNQRILIESQLANAETSLPTVCCNRPFFFEGKKILQRNNIPDRMICKRPFLASNELRGEGFSGVIPLWHK